MWWNQEKSWLTGWKKMCTCIDWFFKLQRRKLTCWHGKLFFTHQADTKQCWQSFAVMFLDTSQIYSKSNSFLTEKEQWQHVFKGNILFFETSVCLKTILVSAMRPKQLTCRLPKRLQRGEVKSQVLIVCVWDLCLISNIVYSCFKV